MGDSMAEVESEQAANDDAAARQAAEVAVELSETDGPGGKRRIARSLRGIAGRGAEAVRRGGYAARHSADTATGTVVRRTGRARRGAGSAGRGVTSGVNWLTGQVVAMGPRLRVRDQVTLRAQFPGRSDDDIAGLLVDRAARATAAVGGATGAWAALPVVPAFPAEVAAETLAVVGIEIKLVAELHEIYGMPAVGSPADRARAYIGSWATRRGVYRVDGGLLLIAGSPLARQLTRRLAGRARRSVFSLSPLLTGAVAGALLNRRETRKFGRAIREELRDRDPALAGNAIPGNMVNGAPPPDPIA
jgi:hypothetical protein